MTHAQLEERVRRLVPAARARQHRLELLGRAEVLALREVRLAAPVERVLRIRMIGPPSEERIEPLEPLVVLLALDLRERGLVGGLGVGIERALSAGSWRVGATGLALLDPSAAPRFTAAGTHRSCAWHAAHANVGARGGVVGVGRVRIGRPAELDDTPRLRSRHRRRALGACGLVLSDRVLDDAEALIELVVLGLHLRDLLAHLGELPVRGGLGPATAGKHGKGRAEEEADG